MQPISALKTVFKKHSITVNGQHILRDGLFYANNGPDTEMSTEQHAFAERMLDYFGAGLTPLGEMLEDKKFTFLGSHGKQVTGFLQLYGDHQTECQSITGMLDEVTLHDLEHYVFPACLRFLATLNQQGRKRPFPVYDVRLYCPVITGDTASLYSGPIEAVSPFTRMMDIIHELIDAKVPEPILVYTKRSMGIRTELYSRLFRNGKSVDIEQGDIDAVLDRFIPNLQVKDLDDIPSSWTTADDGTHWIFDSTSVLNPDVLLGELQRAADINRCTVSWLPAKTLYVRVDEQCDDPAATVEHLTRMLHDTTVHVEAPEIRVHGTVAGNTTMDPKFNPKSDSDK